jgi:hypothetical protein
VELRQFILYGYCREFFSPEAELYTRQNSDTTPRSREQWSGGVVDNPSTIPRHQELLTTNEPPDDCELAFIRSIVFQTGARLSALEKETSRLRDRLGELEEERALLSTYCSQNNAILSPLRRMPAEVLAEIFSWTLPSVQDTQAERQSFIAKRSPWVLSAAFGGPLHSQLPACGRRFPSTIHAITTFPSHTSYPDLHWLCWRCRSNAPIH